MAGKILSLLAVLLVTLLGVAANRPAAAAEPGTFLLYTGGLIGHLGPCG